MVESSGGHPAFVSAGRAGLVVGRTFRNRRGRPERRPSRQRGCRQRTLRREANREREHREPGPDTTNNQRLPPGTGTAAHCAQRHPPTRHHPRGPAAPPRRAAGRPPADRRAQLRDGYGLRLCRRRPHPGAGIPDTRRRRPPAAHRLSHGAYLSPAPGRAGQAHHQRPGARPAGRLRPNRIH